MNSRSLIPALAALCLLALAPLQAQGDLKIATVDMEALMQEHPGTKQIQDEAERRRAMYQRTHERQKRELAEVDAKLAQLQKDFESPSTNAEKKTALGQEIQMRTRDRNNLNQSLQSGLKRIDQGVKELTEMRMKGLRAQIHKLVRQHAETAGYDLVIDQAVAGEPEYSFLREFKVDDITAALNAEIKKNAPAGK